MGSLKGIFILQKSLKVYLNGKDFTRRKKLGVSVKKSVRQEIERKKQNISTRGLIALYELLLERMKIKYNGSAHKRLIKLKDQQAQKKWRCDCQTKKQKNAKENED